MKLLFFCSFLVIYLLINTLFLYKYGLRYESIYIFYVLVIYSCVTGALPYLLKKIKFPKVSFFLIAVLVFIVILLINLAVDGNSLNVDRWSAMDVSLAALLHGEYPYSATDHLNGRSSNLPALLLLGLPGYLLGDVGFLQLFSFAFFVYILLQSLETYQARLLGLLLLAGSSAWLWEVATKSDLLSNFIVLLGFIVLWQKKNAGHIAQRSFLVGGLAGFIFYTRLISFIPLAIFLFQDFVQLPLRKKLSFITASLGVITVLTLVVFKNCPSLAVFKENNPFTLQNRQLPLLVSAGTMLLPLFFSQRNIPLLMLTRRCIVLILLPVLLAFLFSWQKNGFHSIIHESAFDISYFNFVTPFVIYYLALAFEQHLAATAQASPVPIQTLRFRRSV
ncbi:hypothetical protein [Hymenobacter aerophilus]|uniref:hypothetical protein n=1 Tax=Hymenobacter aerophilus TaxID=119644 RepID=UPI00037951CB|nr:hypothetical protein [Hymenobacter aerophilus]